MDTTSVIGIVLSHVRRWHAAKVPHAARSARLRFLLLLTNLVAPMPQYGPCELDSMPDSSVHGLSAWTTQFASLLQTHTAFRKLASSSWHKLDFTEETTGATEPHNLLSHTMAHTAPVLASGQFTGAILLHAPGVRNIQQELGVRNIQQR